MVFQAAVEAVLVDGVMPGIVVMVLYGTPQIEAMVAMVHIMKGIRIEMVVLVVIQKSFFIIKEYYNEIFKRNVGKCQL